MGIEVVVGQLEGIVVELLVAESLRDFLQVLHILDHEGVLFVGGMLDRTEAPGQVLEALYIIKGLRPGVVLGERQFEQAGIGLFETVATGQVVRLQIQLVARIVNLIGIVLRCKRKSCRKERDNQCRKTVHNVNIQKFCDIVLNTCRNRKHGHTCESFP